MKRVIARHEAGGAAPARVPRGRNYDAVAELVAERVEKTKGRISAKRLLPAARAAGYEGSARNFRRLVAAQKRCGAASITVAGGRRCGRRVSTWSSTGARWAGCTCSARCWPGRRVRFVRFADDERAETTLALLAECFEVLGGVPGKVLADRMGCLKGGVVANVVVPDRRSTCGSPRITGSGRTSARPRTRSRRGSWRTWSATPRPT